MPQEGEPIFYEDFHKAQKKKRKRETVREKRETMYFDRVMEWWMGDGRYVCMCMCGSHS